MRAKNDRLMKYSTCRAFHRESSRTHFRDHHPPYRLWLPNPRSSSLAKTLCHSQLSPCCRKGAFGVLCATRASPKGSSLVDTKEEKLHPNLLPTNVCCTGRGMRVERAFGITSTSVCALDLRHPNWLSNGPRQQPQHRV